MSEQYKIPTKDLKLGARIVGKVIGSTYREVKPTLEPVLQDQIRKMLYKK